MGDSSATTPDNEPFEDRNVARSDVFVLERPG
jgi:hypothetical protein